MTPLKGRSLATTLAHLLIVTTILILFSGCPGRGNNSSGPRTDTFSLVLVPQPLAGEGPRPFRGKFPADGVLVGTLNSLTNTNSFRIGIVKPGHNTGECFTDPAATVVLNPNATTTSQDLKDIFGTPTPTFSSTVPLTITACVEGGANPGEVRVNVTYTH